jgi:hypothetical protein
MYAWHQTRQGWRNYVSMQKRKLGKDLTVSALGLGCMSMTSAYGPAADKSEMIRLMRGGERRAYRGRVERNRECDF